MKKIKVKYEGKYVDAEDVTPLKYEQQTMEYKLEDGSILRITPVLLKVVRLIDVWSQDGEPIYQIKAHNTMVATDINEKYLEK